MMEIYITSIDDVLKWLGFEYDHKLPDPSMFNDHLFRRPIISRDPIPFRSTDKIDMTSQMKSEEFVKDRIVFNGNSLWIWRKL